MVSQTDVSRNIHVSTERLSTERPIYLRDDMIFIDFLVQRTCYAADIMVVFTLLYDISSFRYSNELCQIASQDIFFLF